MSSKAEKSNLKRARQSQDEQASDSKKPRRSERISSQHNGSVNGEQMTPLKNSQLPSPLTHADSTATEEYKEGTVEPPEGRFTRLPHRTPPPTSPSRTQNGLSSPPSDTQAFTQTQRVGNSLSHEVEDEEGEGVWGYLIPVDHKSGTLVMRKRAACPVPKSGAFTKGDGKQRVGEKTHKKEEERYEETKKDGIAANGYLIGRHPECDRILSAPTISNRHCLCYNENKGGESIAVLEDLSGNGTFVNGAFVGRNKRRELKDGDEVSILDEARFIFRYPRSHRTNGFHQQYSIQQQLGKGHFATVYLCVEKCSGMKYAVKKFEKRSGPGERSRNEGLQQEIAVLMGVSHPNVLCLKDTFDDPDGVYLVLELAVEGELFNWIVMKSKLTEVDTRKIFIQLFQGVKYLHERNIVHRDIKPENILLVNKDLSIKLADFGLAKIIGEESFTTTLCGTPSYVAPEILESSNHRRYTRAVDVWSLGVVLYICLCGFPPFSDELYSPENPYTLSEQIKLGRFDYPSPYWDPVSDIALDLIDRMLTVDVDSRISIDECLEHPWTTQQKGKGKSVEARDSADSLAGAMGALTTDFSKRKVKRERTLLSSLNTVRVVKEVPVHPEKKEDYTTVKLYEKNGHHALPSIGQNDVHVEDPIEARPGEDTAAKRQKLDEVKPAGQRIPDEFMQMGGVGDQPLFGNDGGSVYAPGNGNGGLEQTTKAV